MLKSRYGESDVEDFVYYDGKCNKWVEMPASNNINDYSVFDNPLWYKQDNNIDEKDEQINQKSKFIL